MKTDRNIRTGYICSFFQMFLIMVPIFVPYQQSLGLSMAEILEIQAIFALATAFAEVPTGYIADVWSRKISVCLGYFVAACAFTYLPFAGNYSELMVFELIIALGTSLISGADFAIVYDSLPADAKRLKIIGAMTFWSLVGEALAAITAGLLVMHSFAAVLWAQAVVGWIPFFASLYFVEPIITRLDRKNPFANAGKVLRHLFVNDSFTRLVFLNCLLWSLSSFCVVWLLQPFWKLSGVPLVYFGVLWAALMLVAAVASKCVHGLEAIVGARTLLLSLSIAPCIGYFLMSLGYNWIGVSAGILFYLNRGFAAVLLQDALNWRVPSSFRATANSIKSLLFRLSFGIFGPVIGWTIEIWSLRTALGLLGVMFSIHFFLFMIPLCKRVKEMRVDQIPEVN